MSPLAVAHGDSVAAIKFNQAFWITRAITTTTGVGLQLAGVYAAWVTFGAWITVALYAVAGLALVLQHLVLGRVISCSPGE